MANNHDYEFQICYHLDWEEKCCCFDITTICEAGLDLHNIAVNSATRANLDVNADNKDSVSSILEHINSVSQLAGTFCKFVNYFEEADILKQGLKSNAPTSFSVI